MARRKILPTSSGTASFVADIGVEELREILRLGEVRFVVEDFLGPLRWQTAAACYDFWKTEVRPHLAEPDDRIHLEDWAGEYAYFASKWDDGGSPIVLLRMTH